MATAPAPKTSSNMQTKGSAIREAVKPRSLEQFVLWHAARIGAKELAARIGADEIDPSACADALIRRAQGEPVNKDNLAPFANMGYAFGRWLSVQQRAR